jgi:hypothetical protein
LRNYLFFLMYRVENIFHINFLGKSYWDELKAYLFSLSKQEAFPLCLYARCCLCIAF